MSENNVIYGINGPVVTIKGETGLSIWRWSTSARSGLSAKSYALTRISPPFRSTRRDRAQARRAGLCYRRRNVRHLGPGIIRNIFDGIERPLSAIAEHNGAFISKGCAESALDEEREWQVNMLVKPGDKLKGGDIYGECPETPVVKHKFMVPPGLEGEVVDVKPDENIR